MPTDSDLCRVPIRLTSQVDGHNALPIHWKHAIAIESGEVVRTIRHGRGMRNHLRGAGQPVGR